MAYNNLMITVRDQHKFKFVVPSQKDNILIINDLLVLSHEDGVRYRGCVAKCHRKSSFENSHRPFAKAGSPAAADAARSHYA